MDYLALRIIEKILVIYFSLYLLIDLGLFFYSFFVFTGLRKKNKKPEVPFEDYPISIIVPAFNEEVSISQCTKMLLEIDYPNYELIIVNDGSSDKTMEILHKDFDLKEKKSEINEYLKSQPIRKIYSATDRRMIVIDKQNGGKADSINSALNYARNPYVCTIDADSILDPLALKEVIRPFIRNKNTMVSGGQLAASNDLVLKHNKVLNPKIPKNIWVLWQINEYIKSFMVSRIGLSRINALLIMSGAFSLYRKDELLEIGGFLSPLNKHPYIEKIIGVGKQTVCEDMEIVVRLFRFRKEKRQKAKATFLPTPVCWTEVPDNGKNLFHQRSRWHQGLAETLKIHYSMIFEPKFGSTGLLGLPYYFIFELLAPVIKVLTLVFLGVSAFLGTINYQWMLLLLIIILLITTVVMSSITVLIENWSQSQSEASRSALRYRTFKDWFRLITIGVIGEFSYSFFKIAAQVTGLINFFRKRSDWKKFERKGVIVE